MFRQNDIKAISEIKITVGLVTYNRPEMLKEAVHSVLQQSFPNFELLISNDYLGSKVSFESMGIEYDPRIKIINQDSNLGEVRNHNFLLEIAQGDWFVWLADDDLFHPEFLMLANHAILNSHNENMVGFFSDYISASSPDGIFPRSIKSSECLYYDAPNFLLNYTARGVALIGCYGVMKTNVLRMAGGLPQLGNSFAPYSDTLIPILLIQHGDLCWIDEKLIFLRTHAESLSCMSTEFSAYTSAEIEFIDQLKHVYGKVHLNISLNKLVSNMVIWFSENEWAVLNRNPVLTKLVVFKEFIKYQININIPRLSLKYSIVHCIFIVHFLCKHFIFNFYRLILRVIKNRLW